MVEFKVFFFGFDFFDYFFVVDYGDCVLDLYYLDIIFIIIEIYVDIILFVGFKFLSFGGDYFVFYLLFKVYVKYYGFIVLV